MGSTYWVRHPSLSGFVGPLTRDELRAAITAHSLPGDARVHVATVGAAPQTLPDEEWVLATEVLGLPRPAVAAAGAARARSVRPAPAGVRAEVRAHSRYAGLRQLAAVLCGVAIVIFGFAAIETARRVGPGALLGAALQIAGVLVVYGAFTMLADIADCQLRQLERNGPEPR